MTTTVAGASPDPWANLEAETILTLRRACSSASCCSSVLLGGAGFGSWEMRVEPMQRAKGRVRCQDMLPPRDHGLGHRGSAGGAGMGKVRVLSAGGKGPLIGADRPMSWVGPGPRMKWDNGSGGFHAVRSLGRSDPQCRHL